MALFRLYPFEIVFQFKIFQLNGKRFEPKSLDFVSGLIRVGLIVCESIPEYDCWWSHCMTFQQPAAERKSDGQGYL